MKFCLLGSGSGGNAVFVEHEGNRILVDAGFSATELNRRLESIGESLAAIEAIVVTHEHGDHIKGLILAAHRSECPVFMTDKTRDKVKWSPKHDVDVQTLHCGDSNKIANFSVRATRVPHDAVDPVAVKISTVADELGGLTIATDMGIINEPMLEMMARSNALVLESNHDAYLLQNSPYNEFTRNRIASNYGHLSNDQAVEFIRNNFDGMSTTIVLAHLSSRANLPKVARQAALNALMDIGLDDEIINLDVAIQDRPTAIYEV